MNTETKSLREALFETGLTDSDFARLVGVSRVTVYKWGKGAPVHRMIQKEYDRVLAAVTRAAENGALPITERRKEERAAQLAEIVEQYS